MKSKDWNSDHPASAPPHGAEVWVAFQEVTAGDESCEVAIGFFDSVYRKWRFRDGVAVSETGCTVCGWLPIIKPTYDVTL